MALSIVQVQSGRLALADSDGNLIGLFDDSGTLRLMTQTKLASGHGLALETGGNLAAIKAKTDNIPSDPARESGKLTSLETILTAIKDTAGIKKITDMISANISQWLGSTAPTVGQKAMAASIPVTMASNQPPVSVTFAIPGGEALPRMVSFFYNQSTGAIVANQWKRVITYTVPAGFAGYLIRFTTFQGEAAYSRICALTAMGSLNIITNVFTAGSSYTLPQWTSDLEVHVTQAIGSAANVVVTIGYTNEVGTAGRTGTVTIPKSSIIGTRLSVALQAGDLGVSSIQTASVVPTSSSGAIVIEGFVQLGYHEDGGTNFMETMFNPGSVAYPAGTVLVLEHQGGTVAKSRRFDVLTQLIVVP